MNFTKEELTVFAALSTGIIYVTLQALVRASALIGG